MPVSLQRVAELLASSGTTMLLPQLARDVFVRDGHLYDGTPPSRPGHLVLAIGLHPDQPELGELIASAADTRQAAVALKADGRDLTRAQEIAAASGIALLLVPDGLAWSHVHSVLVSALAPPASVADDDLGEDLFALADGIAGVFGSSVAIEDLAQNVIGYSSLPGQLIDDVRIAGILGRRVPQTAAWVAQYQQVYAAEGLVRFPMLEDEHSRVAIAVRAGTLPLGSIWAIDGDGPDAGALSEECVRAMERGAELAARHLMRAHEAGEPQARRRRSVFAALLAGQTVSRGELAQLADSGMLTVTAIGSVRAGERAVEVARLVTRQYRALRPQSVVSTGHDAVYVLTSGDDAAAARRLAQEVLTTVESATGSELCAGVSSAYADPAELTTARDEVDDILRCLRSEQHGSRVADTSGVRDRLLLLACANLLVSDPRTQDPRLAVLRVEEDPHWRTLASWLDHACSIPATARDLHIHDNTVRYRLGRVRARFGFDLDDPDTRLALWLRMRASRL